MYMCHLLFQSLFKNQGLPEGGGINVFAGVLHTHLAGNLQLIQCVHFPELFTRASFLINNICTQYETKLNTTPMYSEDFNYLGS